MHDLVIQRLFATGLQLQGAQRLVPSEAQDRISRAVDDIDTTIGDLRASIFELRRQPGDTSFRADIQDLVMEYAEPLGFKPRLILNGPLDTAVPAIARPQILAAIRESLSNVVRHAQATEVIVEVAVGDREMIARITDDGVGITNQDRRSSLRNLRDRAQSLGGTVRLSDSQPHGTIVELRAPLA